jgi:hypothetical protein
MTLTARINEADIRSIIAGFFGVEPKSVTLHHVAAQDDGPGRHSPATVRAEVEGADPEHLARINIAKL